MKSLIILFASAICATIYLEMDFVGAQVAPDKSCKAVMGDLTKRQLNGISACSKSMKFKNGKDKSKKMNCIFKCVLVKEQLLDEKGYFSSDQLDKLLVREFPPSILDKANQSFTPCVAHAVEMDPNPETDEFCTTYDKFIKCLMSTLPSLCSA